MNAGQVMALVAETLGRQPLTAERMTLSHSGNTIFDVASAEGHVIVRMREDGRETLDRTAHNIVALAELGLPVPRILAVDTSRTRYPFAFIMLEKISGRDLLYELDEMTPAQTERLANRIVSIQRRVGCLPEGTGFGWGHVGEGGPDPNWFFVVPDDGMSEPAPAGDTAPGNLKARAQRARIRLQPYFRAIRPTCFLEDLTTKNVILERGELQGLIDFDCVCFGDPLWMVGLAAGCILNDVGAHGLGYIDALCRSWALSELQRQAVAFYAADRTLEFLDDALAKGDAERSERLTAGIDAWLRAVERA